LEKENERLQNIAEEKRTMALLQRQEIEKREEAKRLSRKVLF
jgi:hypothetical protein